MSGFPLNLKNEIPGLFGGFPWVRRKMFPNRLRHDNYGFYVIITRFHRHYEKHFQFKNNKINNKHLIQIIHNNSLCFWPETMLQQQLHNQIMHAFSPNTNKIPGHSLTSSIPGFSDFPGQWPTYTIFTRHVYLLYIDASNVDINDAGLNDAESIFLFIVSHKVVHDVRCYSRQFSTKYVRLEAFNERSFLKCAFRESSINRSKQHVGSVD